jgi:hypothetical protein
MRKNDEQEIEVQKTRKKEFVYLNFLLEKKSPEPAILTHAHLVQSSSVIQRASRPIQKSYIIAMCLIETKAASTLLSSTDMSAMHFAAEKQTAAALLPVGG